MARSSIQIIYSTNIFKIQLHIIFNKYITHNKKHSHKKSCNLILNLLLKFKLLFLLSRI